MCTNRTAPPSGAPGRTAVAAGASSPGGSTAVPDGATEQASEETVPASGARSAAPKGTVGRAAPPAVPARRFSWTVNREPVTSPPDRPAGPAPRAPALCREGEWLIPCVDAVGRSARVRAYPVGRHDAGLTLPAGQSATMNPRELRELIEALWSLAAPRKTR